MKFTTVISSALALAAARAVLVTETDYAYFTVTVNANAPPAASSSAPAAAAPSSSSPSVATSIAPVVTTESSSQAPPSSTNNYVWVPPATTSSTTSSTSSSSSSTPAAPVTTSSTVAPPPPPPTTTSSTTPAPVTTSSEAPAATSGLTPFESDVVGYHNKVRAEHNVGPVTWNQKLADFAQQYLDGDNCVFKHSGGPYGENIALGYANNDDAMSAWYDEYKDYNYSAGQFSEATGHFTQMVWKGTNEVGCATTDCSGRTFLVCEYYPRGNVIGYFTQNVFA